MEREPRPIVELAVHDSKGSFGGLLLEGIHGLRKEYDLGLVYTPETDEGVKKGLEQVGIPVENVRRRGYGWPGLTYRKALEHASSRAGQSQSIIYVDGDRFAVAAYYSEDDLKKSIAGINELAKKGIDCIVGARTPEALATHPPSQILTESIAKEAYSQVLSVDNLDLASGFMGFSDDGVRWALERLNPYLEYTENLEYMLALWVLGVALEEGRLGSFPTGMAGIWETAIVNAKRKPDREKLEEFLSDHRRGESLEDWRKRVNILAVWLFHLYFALITEDIDCARLLEAHQELGRIGEINRISKIIKNLEIFRTDLQIEKLPSLRETVGKHPEVE